MVGDSAAPGLYINSKSVKMHQKLFVCIFCRKYNFIKYKKTFLFFIKTKFLMLLMLNIEDNTIWIDLIFSTEILKTHQLNSLNKKPETVSILLSHMKTLFSHNAKSNLIQTTKKPFVI